MALTKRIATGLKTIASRRVLVPKPSPKRFYGHGIPGVDPERLSGRLVVIEGADGSGRSTQIARMVQWLEGCGHATVQVGLKRSTLVSEELEQAKQGNILSHLTMSLFYATDFADQLENIILPALKAGFMVLADRYIYTLMVRDLVRGMDEVWLKNVYGKTSSMPRTRSRTINVRSEEHTSELQSLAYLVCRLLLEKKKKTTYRQHPHGERRVLGPSLFAPA